MLNFSRLTGLALVALLWLPSGCADLAAREQAKMLEQSVRNYVLGIRWGNYGASARYLRTRDGEVIRADLTAWEDVRVTQYDYAIDAVDENATEARMTASFEYYFVDTNSVRKVYQQTVWWWDPKLKGWFMDGTLPDISRK